MYCFYFVFLLFHYKMSITKYAREKPMNFHIYFHNLSEIHNLQIFLKNKGVINDNKFIADNDY